MTTFRSKCPECGALDGALHKIDCGFPLSRFWPTGTAEADPSGKSAHKAGSKGSSFRVETPIVICRECGMGLPFHTGSCTMPETDPSGKSAHEKGSKLDAGKVDAELLFESFPRALLGVAEVATFGALKYTRNGWQSVPNGIQRYDAAHMRHKLKRLKGEAVDPDSKLLHRFHECWNALAALELELIQKEAKTAQKVLLPSMFEEEDQ